jgi:hypothetical protein
MTIKRVVVYLQDTHDLCDGWDYIRFVEKKGRCPDEE